MQSLATSDSLIRSRGRAVSENGSAEDQIYDTLYSPQTMDDKYELDASKASMSKECMRGDMIRKVHLFRHILSTLYFNQKSSNQVTIV